MRNANNAPTMIVWVISLVLYVLALATQFGVIAVSGTIAPWLWIIGFGLLLVACRVRGM